MAKVPTTEEIQIYIQEYIRNNHSAVRPGEIVTDITSLQLRTAREFGARADEYIKAVKALVEAEVLAWDGGKFLKLGAKAHRAKEPTVKEIQEWIFDHIREKNPGVRSGEIAANATELQIQLGSKHGVRGTEYGGAINGLIQEGYLTFDGGKFLKLTDNGFERL
ncbi:hypothetical protein [Mesorhizobium sp. B1-1-6]|uniref:hypothetical protein n=1 Tax=Mesorhizobium sp. B1-1-6 TaxID=2589978 RepID=UPI001125C1A8|nr:hypothetical protein [Mesorhizobium sp. B1-1-6]TPN35260.1 hypothetical protein FJ979_20525 [Mesorhizobium sp. B1-1-6]